MLPFFIDGIHIKSTSRVREVFQHWKSDIMHSRNVSSIVSISKVVSTKKAPKERQNKQNLGLPLGLEK